MRLEWIDDILAVIDMGSLAQAAQKRGVTQSAFTRRVRSIEDSIGTTLFDRRRKPVTLVPGVQSLEQEMRDLSAQMHRMRQSLRAAAHPSGSPLSIVCQHALTTTISPQIVRAVGTDGAGAVRVRSGNQDACLMQLLSRQVDLAIMYALPDEAEPDSRSAFETASLGVDELIPVCAPPLTDTATGPQLRMIAYPADVFLGQVFARQIAPRLPPQTRLVPVAETALTLAMLQLVRSEMGVAWLPQSLVAQDLAQGALVRLDGDLPAQLLHTNMLRLRHDHSPHSEAIWQRLASSLRIAEHP